MSEVRGVRLLAVTLVAGIFSVAGPGLAQEDAATARSAAPAPLVLPPATQGEPIPTEPAAPTLAAPMGPDGSADAAPPVAPAVPQVRDSQDVAEAGLPVDLSPWQMFLDADVVVKAVMSGLALASLATWTVLLAKSLEILAASRRLLRDLGVILGAGRLSAAAATLAGRPGPAAAMVGAASAEVGASADTLDLGPQGLLPRVSSHLSRIEVAAGRRLTVGTGILATIGATAPFVGLFGTVWGIMNSFIGISRSQTTNLAVVAPGIAEALLATAIGLVAAIPAVVIYNVFARWIAAYRARLADAAAGVERLVSRDLDHRRLAVLPHPHAAAHAAE